MKSLEKNINNIRWAAKKSGKEIKRSVYVSAFEKMKDDIEANEGGDLFYDTMKKYLESSNVKPVYETEADNPEIAAMREKLNTESGIIISNHPGYFDSAVILNLMHRDDLKIVVSSQNYQKFVEFFGPDKFIEALSAGHDVSRQLAEAKKIRDHLKSGGALLIFPTAGSDAVDKKKTDDELHFESGFGHFVKKYLKPDDMVYSFWVEPDDVAAAVLAEKIPRSAGALSEVYIGPSANINKLKETKPIRVKEAYSRAEEWQEEMSGPENKEDKNKKLAAHYLDQFNS